MLSIYQAVRQAVITLGVSLVIAAGVLGWSMPDPPKSAKYAGFVIDNKVVRLNTQNGNIVACDFSRCVRVLGNGKYLQPNSAPGLAAPIDAQAQRNLPSSGAKTP